MKTGVAKTLSTTTVAPTAWAISETALYNLKSDPGEKTDVAAENPEVVARIEAIMLREHVPSPLFPLLPGERRNR